MKHLHQNCEPYEAAHQQEPCVMVDPCLGFSVHEGEVFHTLDKHEVYDCRKSDASENSDLPFQVFLEIESEQNTGDVLNQETENECDGHRYEYRHYH